MLQELNPVYNQESRPSPIPPHYGWLTHTVLPYL